MNTLENLREIVRRIEEFNRELRDNAIPQSDDIYRKYMNDLAESEDQLLFHLRILHDAHFIFIIHIIEPDDKKGAPGVYGYVVADTSVLSPLIAEYNRRLEAAHEAQTGKRKGAASIIREMMANVREFTNTPLGKVLHICIMLDQFMRLMADRPEDYTAYFREVQLRQLLPELGGGSEGGTAEEGGESLEEESPFHDVSGAKTARRAVDTLEYRELSTMDLSGAWGKAVEKYGVNFLIRVHLRKHDFDTLKRLVFRRRIAREEDLRYLRDTLRIMNDHYSMDKDLQQFIEPIRDLKRFAQLKLNQFSLIRKKYEEELDV